MDGDNFQGQRFCQDCNVLLYPEEYETSPDCKQLIYKCKICGMGEVIAPDSHESEFCVYKTDLEAKAERLNINTDIVDDPTLAKRTIDKCKTEECNSNQVVTFYHITQNHFQLIYVCVKCRNHWKMMERDVRYDINDDTDEDPEIGEL